MEVLLSLCTDIIPFFSLIDDHKQTIGYPLAVSSRLPAFVFGGGAQRDAMVITNSSATEQAYLNSLASQSKDIAPERIYEVRPVSSLRNERLNKPTRNSRS